MMLLVIGGIFFATILIGVPIAFGMGLAGATWILFFEGMEPTILVRRFYYALNSFPLLAIHFSSCWACSRTGRGCCRTWSSGCR